MDYVTARERIMNSTDISDYVKGYYIAVLNLYKNLGSEMYERYDEKTVDLVRSWCKGSLYGSGVEDCL